MFKASRRLFPAHPLWVQNETLEVPLRRGLKRWDTIIFVNINTRRFLDPKKKTLGVSCASLCKRGNKVLRLEIHDFRNRKGERASNL